MHFRIWDIFQDGALSLEDGEPVERNTSCPLSLVYLADVVWVGGGWRQIEQSRREFSNNTNTNNSSSSTLHSAPLWIPKQAEWVVSFSRWHSETCWSLLVRLLQEIKKYDTWTFWTAVLMQKSTGAECFLLHVRLTQHWEHHAAPQKEKHYGVRGRMSSCDDKCFVVVAPLNSSSSGSWIWGVMFGF